MDWNAPITCSNPQCPDAGRCGGACVAKWDVELEQMRKENMS